MSRGFVKEGDQEDVPLVTARAFLPPGVENFVTAEGLQALKDERESLVDERRQFEGVDTPDARVNSNYITAKIKQVDERIRTARLTPFDPEKQHEVAFGATVRFKNLKNGVEATYRIVGVDEAAITKGKISFLSPLSKALLNHKTGDVVSFDTPQGTMEIKILEIT